MDNSFFIYTDKTKNVLIERFHMCTWEFSNDSSLVEFGFEINKNSISDEELTIDLFVPWVTKNCQIQDLYQELSNEENSRFIFNDSIYNKNSLDGGSNKTGVIHTFSGRNKLCILPINIRIQDKIISATVKINEYNEIKKEERPNVYFRFFIKPKTPYISIRKSGINKSTIIYDIKINEQRNIPEELIEDFREKSLCKIRYCFSFNILPNKYDIVFFDSSSLQNVRSLEYDSFNKYLGKYIGGKSFKKDELLVVFNKKEVKEYEKDVSKSFSFFSIYSKETIGTGQFAVAVLINIFCGILLFIPSFKKSFDPELKYSQLFSNFSYEIYFALSLALLTFLYFIWPNFIWPKMKIYFAKLPWRIKNNKTK